MERVGGGGERGRQLAGGQGIQGAEAAGEFGGGYAALAVEGAQKVFCGRFAFLGVALDAAGDEITVGIAAHAGKWHDMVEAADAGGEPAQTIKAEARVARVNRRAPRFGLEEIHLLDAGDLLLRGHASHSSIRRGGADLAWQADFDHVTSSVAFDQAQRTLSNEAAYRVAYGPA